MSNHDDLQTVIDQLRAHRPKATALELDAIKQRVRTRAGEPARRRTRRAELMKSRLVILTMLVLGMLLSTAGAGLAVSGLTGNDSASVGQYASPAPTPHGGGGGGTPSGGGSGVLGEQNSGGGQTVLPSGSGGTSPSGGNAGGSGVAGETSVQPARQVEAGSDTGSSLPFTGFAAVPILFGGIVLLSGGLLLRRRAGAQD